MERVVTINLNGNPYQLEEPAYDALRAYVSRAEAALASNPDKAEIIRDLQQAIADKCSARLGPSKSVVNASEMAAILAEMGPVEGDSGAESATAQDGAPRAEFSSGPTRRLYRIYDRGAWTGVSAGMAAYAGIGVDWVRVGWVLATLFTGGFAAVVYIAMIFVVPVASTSEELAAAHGAPFNAQEVIDRAKREYAQFTDQNAPRWRAEWRRQRRQWNEQMNSWRASSDRRMAAAAPPVQAGYVTRVFAGIFAFVFSVITAALLIAFLVAFFSLITTREILGWEPPLDAPFWMVLVILGVVYAAISSPFSALRKASYETVTGQRDTNGSDGIATAAIVLIVGVLAWIYVPEARQLMEQAYVVLRDFSNYVRETWLTN
ncbi:MAG: PspC domain-containing protein [Hyphomonadaceae bacterium]|nr:PspC domain-containing protein [Hyphomonadaceae bacterium]